MNILLSILFSIFIFALLIFIYYERKHYYRCSRHLEEIYSLRYNLASIKTYLESDKNVEYIIKFIENILAKERYE